MGQKRKMSRGEVLAMQGIMKNLGFYLGETGPLGNGVDGDWGPLSKSASTKLDSLLKEGYSDQEIFQHNISDGKRR